jgi:hypothetical protein
MEIELRRQRAGAYFLSDEQQKIVLDRIAEVGADIRRFCAYLRVEAVAKIPAHEFDDGCYDSHDMKKVPTAAKNQKPAPRTQEDWRVEILR